jgi:hypothetical protein
MRARVVSAVMTALCVSLVGAAASAQGLPELERPRWSVHVGGGGWVDPLSDSVGSPGAVVHGSRSIWVGPAWGGAFQFSGHARGVLGVSQRGAHALAGATFGFELGWLTFLSIETQVGAALGGFAGGGGVAATAGMMGSGGWCLRPFEDKTHKLVLGGLFLPQFTLAPESRTTDCPLCPSLMLSLGYEGTF